MPDDSSPEMLPPEMLPRCMSGDAEVIVCRGAPYCAGGQAPCPFCVRITNANECVVPAYQ